MSGPDAATQAEPPHRAALAALAARLRAARRAARGGAEHALGFAALFAAILAGSYLARLGTGAARGAALAFPALVLVSLVVAAFAAWRRWREPRRAVVRATREQDPALGDALDRAVGLVEREGDGTVEGALAALHLERRLGEVRVERVAERASRGGRDLAGVALGVATLSAVVIAVDPLRPIEGLDVWLARDGRAPFGLLWVDELDVLATPPAYLGQSEEALDPFDVDPQPRGTVIAVRARPLRSGRQLVLTDGLTEVGFVDDGTGRVVARWTLGESAALRVAARFGDVVVEQRDVMEVESVPDLAPRVSLVGAPRTVRLADVPSVELAWEAQDDHGLREVALVMRGGGREERRTLSRPASDKKVDRGAYELAAKETFLRRSHVPVEITIEAKDNDAVLGPKWGKSAAIVVVPPLVGETEAKRFEALLGARDALVDLTAARVVVELASAADAKARVAEEKALQEKAVAEVERVLAQSFGDLRVRGGMRRVAAGQLRRLGEALAAFERRPDAASHAALVTTTEEVTLAFDAALRSLGVEDARRTAKRLADVAKEAAAAARTAADPLEAAAGQARLEAALTVLPAAGRELAKLGELGADLGDLVRGGTERVARERARPDLRLAELAALDLAERLANPMSSVGGGGRPGVESGAPTGGGEGAPDEGEASDAAGEAEANEREIDDLVERHAQEIEKLDQAMKDATSQEERDRLKELAREHAGRIREAVRDLPEQGTPGSQRGKAADARRRAESMADALERGDPKGALEAGRNALEALREAAKSAEQQGGSLDPDAGADERRAGNRVEEALQDLERALEGAESAAKDRSSDALRESGQNEERLAERTRDLIQRGDKGDGSLPDDVLEKLRDAEQAMRDAKKALDEGDAQRGSDRQREAQRLLEMARGEDDPAPEDRDGSDGDGRKLAQDADVPEKDRHKGPEAFKKRVIDGLGASPDARLQEAVKRYAEGLLR